jgi:hypothetical protein
MDFGLGPTSELFTVPHVFLEKFLQELCLSLCPLNGCKFMRNSCRIPPDIPVKLCHSWYYSEDLHPVELTGTDQD